VIRTINLWRPGVGTISIAIRWIVAYQIECDDIIIETGDAVSRRFPATPNNVAEMKKLQK